MTCMPEDRPGNGEKEKIDDNPISGRTLVASFVTSAARSFSSTTSQANKNASQIELTSAKMRRAVPGVGRSSEKFRNKAKCSNEGRLIMKEVGVNVVIVFLRKRRTIVVRLGKGRRCARVQWCSEMQTVLTGQGSSIPLLNFRSRN